MWRVYYLVAKMVSQKVFLMVVKLAEQMESMSDYYLVAATVVGMVVMMELLTAAM